MQNNYFFIRQLVAELRTMLPGSRLSDAYSQNKDEAILSFLKAGKEIHVIAHLTGQFTCLAFPDDYAKAGKNTATIFPELLGLTVINVLSYENERALTIEFADNYQLVFKLFGRQANLILFSQGEVIDLFKKVFKSDFNLDLRALHRPIDQSKEAIKKALPNIKEVYPTLDKNMVRTIEARIAGKAPQDAVTIIIDLIEHYNNPSGYLVRKTPVPALEIALDIQPEESEKSALAASTKFFFSYLHYTNLNQLRNKLLNDVKRKISKTEVYLTKVRRKVESLEHETNYRQMADLLMANLHNVSKNANNVTLENFYNEGKPLKIKLNSQLSAQQNAERYYKKGKNVSLEIDNLKKSIRLKEKLLLELIGKKEEISGTNNLKTLRRYSKSEVVKAERKEVPFKTFIIEGYTIYVGNNARQNDLLTLKYAKKDDLFFHAKDVSGSHVILKDKSGSNVPVAVLETTASIAAYYSKRKTDSLCPVGYTQKKYVRKPKGSPPGLVLVEREKVILVPPGLPEIN